jgi:uncharacterized protein (TIGR02145 family)
MKRALLLIIICSIVYISCNKDNNPVNSGVPSAPALVSPLNNSNSIFLPTTLAWNVSPGATSYTLQVSTINSFDSLGYYDTNITVPNQQITSLKPLTQYYWRVKSTNEFGTSDWSAPIWTFSTASGGNTGNPCPGLPTLIYSGRTYHTVQIGSQCWLKENLNVGTMIVSSVSQTNDSTIEKYCYQNDSLNCNLFGGLYTWNEIMQYQSSGTNIQGLCPSGWHIPTDIEYKSLSNAVSDNGNSLKALLQGGGKGVGTDSSGFSALFSGYCQQGGGFSDLHYYTNFWTSIKSNSGYAIVMWLSSDNGIINQNPTADNETGFSVRCIKN